MSQVEVNTNVNSVNVNNTINTVDVNQDVGNIIVVPQVVTEIIEVVTPGPQGPKGDPGDVNLLTGSFVSTSSFFAFTASYYIDSSSFNSRIDSIEGVSGSWATTGSNIFRGDQIITGSITVTTASTNNYIVVDVDTTANYIRTAGSDFFIINSTPNKSITLSSDVVTIENYSTQQPVVTVSQSIVQFTTQSFDPTGSTQAGSIWFTSSSLYVGLE